MAKLTRSLLGGIRRVPEQKSKAESSQGTFSKTIPIFLITYA